MAFNTPRYVTQILVCVACTIAVLMWRTNGFVHYTYESARRANVDKHPVILSDWQLEDEQGQPLAISSLGDKLLLVNFIYTRCPTICQALGSRYQQLQQAIEDHNATDVLLLSISIDPEFDTPARLNSYRTVHRGHAGNWHLTRPLTDRQMRNIIKETGLRVIADNFGGYNHSDSIHVVQSGKLISINDWDSQSLEALITNEDST